MRRLFCLLCCFVAILPLWATHQRAGEITYEYINGLTYRFTIVTYTYTPSPADRPEIEISWGDGSVSIVARTWKYNLDNDISRNVYITEHTYPSTGTFSITFEDPNRNNGIVNIPNSVNIPFFLETTITINPFLGPNSSPELLNPPIDDGCVNKLYVHNPGCYDRDGDSLSYQLITCRGYDGENIPGYTLPLASNSISIDPVTGDLIWDCPRIQGEYNVAILITEWRYGVAIGTVVRDMQITITNCNNNPPEIWCTTDTCITVGDTLALDIVATDAESSNVLLTASGGIFNLPHQPAHFIPAQGHPPITASFMWTPDCSHVRHQPYSVLFKAKDNGPQVELTNFKTLRITVVAPAPQLIDAVAEGNEITIRWLPYTCSNCGGFYVYRRQNSYDFVPEHCQTGLPAYTGYQLIAHTNDTVFVDQQVQHSTEYCYRIVAYFSDGAESYVSDEVCTILHNDVPRLTNIDVVQTDTEEGMIFVKWLRPDELDTIQYPGPNYEYRLYRTSSLDPAHYSLVIAKHSLFDTIFMDNGLNTSDLSYFYKVEVWAQVHGEMVLAGISDIATSEFLTVTPQNCQLQLHWTSSVPWTNTQYVIYRKGAQDTVYDSIAVTSENTWVDAPLLNGLSYCYYIQAIGGYFVPDTVYPFFNRSQQVCAIPADNVAPEIPILSATTDCEKVTLSWSFRTDTSYLDVYQYFVADTY